MDTCIPQAELEGKACRVPGQEPVTLSQRAGQVLLKLDAGVMGPLPALKVVGPTLWKQVDEHV